MAGWTNRGKYRMLNAFFRNNAVPTNLYMALVTDAAAPGADTNEMSELTEIADTQGYTAGGYQLNRNSTDFDVLTEDDVNDRALVQIKDLVWTANGGNLPASGGGARYAVLTDDDATAANRDVLMYFSLGSPRTVSDTQTLTLIDAEIRINES
jgi:hypothetical protein